MELRRFWFEFEIDNEKSFGWLRECGVTACDRIDALRIMKQQLFRNKEMPPVSKCVEDVDVSTLDPNHVLPNMGMVTKRGIWFPLGYEE